MTAADPLLPGPLPAAARGAVEIVQELTRSGHQALLAGGCVRDLLLGLTPEDYDVATDADPDRICALFRATRRVGAQFGVVLVRRRGRWVEVATFRTDGNYEDGRRPTSITFTDARHDALRRDFTINGMFLDALTGHVIDYVGGREDLAARTVRAIGEPAQRFAEDYLRLLRAIRFAARLDFDLESVTAAAIRTHAARLAQVAAERVREELERVWTHPRRQRAWQLLADCALLPHLWPGAGWTAAETEAIATLLGRLPTAAPFELTLALALAARDDAEVERVGRALTLSNEQLDNVRWLVAKQAALDMPKRPTLADLKRLMAHRMFPALCDWATARYVHQPDGEACRQTLRERVAAIPPERVQPPPFVRGDDLKARRIAPGPVYAELLDELYTRQLDEVLQSREDALATLDALLKERGLQAMPPKGKP